MYILSSVPPADYRQCLFTLVNVNDRLLDVPLAANEGDVLYFDQLYSPKVDIIKFQYGGRLGEFNGMSSQSHVSHCRVLPLGEFTVTIPEPHATLQGAVT